MGIADDILSAVALPAKKSWINCLTEEQHAEIRKVRDAWKSNRRGISAIEVSRRICQRLEMDGVKMPRPREVQRWLTQV